MKSVLVDTSIQIDRLKAKHRKDRIESALSEFEFTLSTGISVLEFKATVIAECILIHDTLRQKGHFTLAQDVLLEKNARQVKLRGHIFRNIIRIQESSFTIDEQKDRLLAEQARLQLQRIIPRLYTWFMEDSVDAIQTSEVFCTRASEEPKLKRVAFSTNLPLCKTGENKFCKVEQFVREKAATLAAMLRSTTDSQQVLKACDLIDEIVSDATKNDLSHGDCRTLGDCLIALEGRTASHALSTNQRDWIPICAALNKEFVPMAYPEDKGR
jgi:hypothetical protein